ncbi:Uncharacterised protein [uncultured Clostridium sp.]|nr:Uncharacterised protein [uncultured Clostridium sp.]
MAEDIENNGCSQRDNVEHKVKCYTNVVTVVANKI